MATLTGKLVSDTYKALLKMIDNDILTETEKQISDGYGQGTGIFIDDNGFIRAQSYRVTGANSSQFLKGDGSLDSNTYLSLAAADALFLTQSEADGLYLPIGSTTSAIAEGSRLYFTQPRVLSTVLTGFVSTSGTVTASDSVLSAIEKLWWNIVNGGGGGGGGYIPYVGALQNVNLGEWGMTAGYYGFDLTPTGTPTTAGTMSWNSQDGTADIKMGGGNVTLQVGQEELVRVVNKTGANLLEANYQAVRVSGAQGNRLKVSLAKADNDANSADTIGLVTETINDNLEGFVTAVGLVRNIDTTGDLQGETWADGEMVYLSADTAGMITNIKPQAPQHGVRIGYVVRAHKTQGQIYVKVDNGYELDELHNVLITDPVTQDILTYDETLTGGLWINRNIWTAIGATEVGKGFLSIPDADTLIPAPTKPRIARINLDNTVDAIEVGTQGYLPFYDATDFYPDSPVFTDGTDVVIGGETPNGTNKLTVIGGIWGEELVLNDQFLLATNPIGGNYSFNIYDGTSWVTQMVLSQTNLVFNISGFEKMRLNSSGYLGIGTDTPTALIHAKGTTAYPKIKLDNASTSGGGMFSAYQNGTEIANFGVSGAWLLDSSSDVAIVATKAGQGIQFYTNGSNSEKMGINSDGNLFVGQTPTFVAGATQAIVRGKTGAGFLGVQHYDMSIKGSINTFNNVFQVGTSTFHSVAVIVEDVERARFNSGGRFLLGTTTDNTVDIFQANGSIIATAIKKTGGTSAQYLMADGSVSTLASYVPTSRTLTINGTAQDLTANRSWSVGTVTSVAATVPTGFAIAGSPITSSGTLAITFAAGYGLPTTAKQTEWDTAYTNRITSLTTTGSSGAATLLSNVLNIPTYTLAGLGGVPTSRTLTINGTAFDLSADRSWTIAGTIGGLTTNYVPKATGTSSLGNSNITDSGSLITLGSNTNISSGRLGIGTVASNNYSLIVAKDITGNVISYGINQSGVSQTDVTTSAYGFTNTSATAASAYTLLQYFHYSANQGTIGAGSAITTQIGFNADTTLTGATNNFGFRGRIPAGTGRWNLYMDGTANNHMAGSLGIGSTTLAQYSLRVSKTITGSTDSVGIFQNGAVQSDVTGTAYGYSNQLNTQATTFALTNYYHYTANQNSIGAGNTITNQAGFLVSSNLTGATNNYGFFGSIAAGAGRWNLFMSGTANNYMAGSLGIGATTLTGYSLRISKAITGNVQSFGALQEGTVSSDVTSTVYGYANDLRTQASAFTLVNYIHFSAFQASIGAGSSVTTQTGFLVNSSLTGATNNYGFRGQIASGTGRWNIYMDGTANNFMAGSLGIGTTTLTGYSLRISKTLTGGTNTVAVNADGVVQSDSTSSSAYFSTFASTQAATYTIGNLVHFNASQSTIGSGSTVTNQYGFTANSTLIGATNNFGFYGNLAAGTGRWNLYMNGTANNYLAGSLGIGSTSLTGVNLIISKGITGAVSSYGVIQQGNVQSDVTTQSFGFYNIAQISTGVTLATYAHFATDSSAFAGTVTNQYGFRVGSSLTGGTNNYGFRSAIPSGTGRWNIYMDGTADNYLAGSLGIGSGKTIPTYALDVAGDININSGQSYRIGGTAYTIASTSTSGFLSSTDWNTFNAKQGTITLTTTGTSGAATLIGNTLNIPQYTGGVISFNTRTGAIVLTSADVTSALTYTPYNATNPSNYIALTALSAGAGISYNNTTGVISSTITQYTDALARASISAGTGISYNSTTGVITNTITQYTDALARASISGGTGISYNSTTGVITNTITQYTDALARLALSGTAPITYNNSTGAIGITQASGSTNGFLSSTDWNTFNNKQNALTNPVTGTGTINYVPKFTGTSALGNSLIYDNGTSVIIGGTSSSANFKLSVEGNSNLAGDTNIGGFIYGNFSKTLPTGNTFAGQTININGSANGWNLINRNTWNFTDDAFTTNGVTMYDNRAIITRSTTASIGYINYQSYIVNNGTASQSATGIWSFAAGTGNFGSFIAYKVGANGPVNNTNSYTKYIGIDMSNTPQNNVTNYYGIAIADFTGTTLSRGIELSLSAGTGKWNIYASGTANNYLAGSLGIGSTTLTGVNLSVVKTITGSTTSKGMQISGIVQSDVTTKAYGYHSALGTQATAFTLNQLEHFTAEQLPLGAGSVINAQTGFLATASLTSATLNYGFRGLIPSGTGRWNLYIDGTANNYLAGSLGIGTTTLTTQTLNIGKNITGGTSASGIVHSGYVQSDVTSTAYGFTNSSNTAATSFTLSNYYHYNAQQGTFGAGSTVTNQYGFIATNLTGATNNYGFYGNTSAGTGRWNLYMNGTANNYLAGSLGIGGTTFTGFNGGNLFIGKAITGNINSNGVGLTSTINSDVTGAAVGYRTELSTQASTFTLDQIRHYQATQGTIGAGSTVGNQFGFWVSGLNGATNNYGFYGNIAAGTSRWNLYMAGTANNHLAGSLLLGTTADDASSLLTMQSTTKGFLPPRMTAAQRGAIASPAEGLVVVQTDGTKGLYLYINAAWHALTML